MCKQVLLVLALVFSPASFAYAVMVSAWDFEGATGTNVPDVGGGGHAGTLVGDYSVIDSGDPTRGKVLRLDGLLPTTGYMNVGGGRASSSTPLTWADPTDMTITIWVKTPGEGLIGNDSSTLPDWWGLMSKVKPGSIDTGSWYLNGYTVNDQLDWKTYGGAMPSGTMSRIYEVDESIGDGEWHLLALTLNDAQQQIYIDGVLVQENTLAQSRLYSTQDIWFGSVERYPTHGWTGDLDDIHFYNHVLSQSEISALVPEPSALTLLATGLIGLLAYAWRRRRS